MKYVQISCLKISQKMNGQLNNLGLLSKVIDIIIDDNRYFL